MAILQKKIKEYLQNHSVRNLMKATQISSGIIYLLKDWVERKYNKRILDNMYLFFHLEKDLFYKKNISIPQSSNFLWHFFKLRRERLWLKRNEVAKLIKWEERQIKRFENGEVCYNSNSYYFKELIKLYNINPQEKELIQNYTDSLKNLIHLQKQEKVLFLNNKENTLWESII